MGGGGSTPLDQLAEVSIDISGLLFVLGERQPVCNGWQTLAQGDVAGWVAGDGVNE